MSGQPAEKIVMKTTIARLNTIAENCMKAAYEGTMIFPEILKTLAHAGFEGYLVDYRKNTTTYYLAEGDPIEVANVKTPGLVAAEFKAEVVEANVRKSQANTHTYKEFCENIKNAGCAGYIVTLLGRRVVYYGRTGETHIEHFPS